ncbi:MAG: putative metal-binding motif-containing protein [Myxococcales bacterium]|nr:putative metal-binding motif-containing protein [Myxococcales bacterium]
MPTRFAVVVLTLIALLVTACGNEVVVYDAIRLEIGSEVPDGGPITFYDIGVLGLDADGAVVEKLPAASGDGEAKKYAGPLPAGVDLVNTKFKVDLDVNQGGASPVKLQLRIRGLDDNLKVLTSWSGVVVATTKKKISVMLVKADANCDADGDGVKDCAKDGCCAEGEATDCSDDPAKGSDASPFSFEDSCTQCGNGIDEDCDGEDTKCVDSDGDGAPDCQELKCGPGADKDKTVYPGAPEVCDLKDNDCDGKVDEDLPYTGIDGNPGSLSKGDSCGAGACAGGTAVCSADGKGLVCSSADKKADKEACDNQVDDDCNGKVNDGCALQDIDGDGVPNDKEDAACAFKFARFHSEYHPGNTVKERCCISYTKLILDKDSGWTPKSPIPSGVKATDAVLSTCDTNCDGKVDPCAPKDTDGDGVAAPLDCDDTDPLSYPGAAEKCGDGKVQGCVGSDPACDSATDKDGDGWAAPADCNDDDKAIAPDAVETCNGKDDDCDGFTDNGNPEAEDKTCGDPDGECGKQPGVSVCKHWPASQEPGKLDCLQKAFDKDSLTCVGCEGDKRPTTDVCDYLDNDCDGKADEDYTYKEESSAKSLVVGADCDGIGACGKGKVECRITKDKAVCSTDVDGSKNQSKTEICDNKDNNCNGTTDESLTTISDSTCAKTGVCAGASVQKIVTVCKAGKWVCDYTKVPSIEFDSTKECQPGDAFCHCPGLGTKKCFKLVESTCEGKDNDCDGKTDDDFLFSDLGKDKKIAAGCGTGACASGTVVCKGNGTGLTCSSLGKITKEVCDSKDNDCNGKTDDGMTVTDSPCKLVGQCNNKNVTSACTAGKWVCDYSLVKLYQGNKETSCDGYDNDCDGKTDEDFNYDDLGNNRTITQSCGKGECAKGNVVCMNDKTGVTCSTAFKKATEICDTKDNDCDGVTDEGFKYLGLATTASCDGVGACGKGVVECTPGSTKTATCSTNPNGSKKENTTEICDDKDNDCDGKVDEGCDDDGDKHCDAKMSTPGKPKTCVFGGGDCNDANANINPSTKELCNDKDDDCNSKTDETFIYTQVSKATGKTWKLAVKAQCGLGVCVGGTVKCAGTSGVTCSTLGKASTEICDGKDNNCDGRVDEGCDDDKDDYCDENMTVVGKPSVCPNGGGDCNDKVKTTFPTAPELCDNVDNDCNSKTDELCDQDGDDFCDLKRVTIGKPTVCPKGGGDCNDTSATGKPINPDATETCDGEDNDCSGGTDEDCDQDGDGYCDENRTTVGTPKSCPKGGGDCNDKVKAISPSAVEICNNINDNCKFGTDEGCDDDNDDYCDDKMVVVGKPNACPKGGGDCNDGKSSGASQNPAAPETCNNVDDDCDSKTDAADPTDLAKTAPLCDNQKGVCKGVRRKPAQCKLGVWTTCPDVNYTIKSTYESKTEKTCDDLDNNCSGAVDEGCDDDNDKWCDDKMAVKGKPKVCPNGGGDCREDRSSFNPGAQETCLTDDDENCNGDNNDKNAKHCVLYYQDGDGDGFGVTSSGVCMCKPVPALNFTAKKSGDCNDASKAANTFTYSGMGGSGTIGETCGTGICAAGKVVCDGKKASCSTLSKKKNKETCNGKDDTCDGTTDVNPDMSSVTCNTKGVCAAAAKECIAGNPLCRYDLLATYEANEATCDNKDNDCDGSTDESLMDVSKSDCKVTGVCTKANVSASCSAGKWTCDYKAVPGYQSATATETSCDTKDNDCDGTTDEGCP